MLRDRIKVVEGDLLDQDVDVIVNAWNRNVIPWWLLLPQGVSGAIKRRAGYQPFRELARKGPIPLGGAVETGAGRLTFKAIIQSLPRWSLAELTSQYPHLRLLKWAHLVFFPGIYFSAVLGWAFLLQRFPGWSDEQIFFLLAMLISVVPMSLGALALRTGVYRGIGARWFTKYYYRISGTRFRWLPLAQTLIAVSITAISLVGFLSCGSN